MKKALVGLLSLLIALSLAGCGKSESVKNVESLISSIGTVTLDSEEQITAANEAYNALSDEEKKQVSNYDTLLDAEKEYDSLGIKLTKDNYEKYLNISCSQTLKGELDYGEVMGASHIGSSVYTAIDISLSVSAKSQNYDYNDVIVEVKITGYYVPLTANVVRRIGWNLTMEEYYYDNMNPIDITLTATTDIVGSGEDVKTIELQDEQFLLDNSVEISGYEIVSVSGTMTPV